jgi:hypothetical protein
MGYCIIETDNGLTIVEFASGQSPEEAAERAAGSLIDPGPYAEYEEAEDALIAMQTEMLDDNASNSDVPGTRALEGREDQP